VARAQSGHRRPGRQALIPTRRGLIVSGLAASLAGPALAAGGALQLAGRYQQGGFALGRTAPRADLFVDGVSVGQASRQGLFVIGFDRDSPPSAALSVRTTDGEFARQIAVAPGRFDIQRINGLPADQVEPSDPALLARIKAEVARKAVGFSSNVDADDFKDGFLLPVTGARLSARFGGQRILNGDPKRPHYGSDLAAPLGTPVLAPAPGVVSFAETGLHFDGALVLLDHGQGLISCYLHLSRVDVKAGDALVTGQRIGAVGMEGRATGPHLCWRLKWHGRNLDPMLLVGARAPA
jgi:murein DD-endopeptidase MepM/ murein hydrolase activator NlpD